MSSTTLTRHELPLGLRDLAVELERDWDRALAELTGPVNVVTAKAYGLGVKHLVTDTLWLSDTIKCALTTSAYTPNQDTHEFFSDVTNEITGTGYTAGGVTLASKAITYDSATNEIRFDAADPAWTGATITDRLAILYKSTGTAGTSPLIAYIDFGADQSVTGGGFTIVLDSTGALKITAA